MNLHALAKGQGAATAGEDRLGTPWWLLDQLQQLWGRFTFDLAAEPWSAVVESYVSEQQDLFKVGLNLVTPHGFGNWPYGRGQLIRFVPFAREMVLSGRVPMLTQLLPNYSAEGWFQHLLRPEGRVRKAEWLYGRAGHERLKNWTRYTSDRLVVDLITIKGRVEHRYPPRYTKKRGPSPFSSVVARFSLP